MTIAGATGPQSDSSPKSYFSVSAVPTSTEAIFSLTRNREPMKSNTKTFKRAWALNLSLSIVLIFVAPAALGLENNSNGKRVVVPGSPDAHQRATISTSSSAAPKRAETQPSLQIEFAASRAEVDGREVAGFIARQPSDAQEENVNAPAGLKPLEEEAWLAMARRQRTSGHGMELTSFYPKRSGDPFIVEGQGVRVAVRPLGSSDVAAQLQNSQVIYSNAYELTDSFHMVSAGRSEEFLFLRNECAPHQFEYEVSELSAGVRIELVGGEVRFRTESGRGVKIEAPWVMDAKGERRTGVVRWELQERKGEAKPLLRLVLAEGLSYPLVIDPSWVTTGNLATARSHHTATLLPSGKVLVAGGFNESCSETCGALSSAELYDPATGLWSPTGSLATARWLHTATLLPSGKVLVAGGYNTSIGGLSSAELYDPASGTWSATGSLWAARDSHTATLLPSGKVLVAGEA